MVFLGLCYDTQNTSGDQHQVLLEIARIDWRFIMFRQSIFITGFPGFIAGRLVARLANSDTQFFLLVQPHFVEKAMEDIVRISDDTRTPLECFVIVEGDITRPDLGVGAEDLETIRFETTDVYHLAAIYDLAVEKDLAFSVNLEGTRNVNEFVRTVKNLYRYNYISTCYVAGKRLGVINEDDLEHDAGFRNYYEETKYLAEMEVQKLRSDLPVTIFRPSVVVGDSVSGETTKYDGIYYLIKYLMKAPALLRVFNVGNDDVRLNLVPVDFVVDGITALARDDAATGKTIALADPSPLTTAELFDAIAKEMTSRKSEFKLPKKLAEWFLNTGLSPVITGLPHYAVPYFFIAQTYGTGAGEKLLKPHGVNCPGFAGYVGNMIEFVTENPIL
jgi:nucleoside-diphosphate-sugar epimerase